MAEDSHVPPLPRRAPDDKRPVPGGKPAGGSGLTQPLVLPESLRQRIHTVLDCGEDGAPPPANGAPQEAGLPAEAAAPAGTAARPGPPVAVPAEPPSVPAQRAPAEQQPDRHDHRGGAGNRSWPRAPMTRAAMWAYFEHAEAPTGPLPAIPAAVPTPRAPAGHRLGQPAQPGAPTAGPGQETAGRDEVLAHQENAQASPGRAEPQEATGLDRRPGQSRPWAPPEPPAAPPPEPGPPKSVSPQPVPPQLAPPKSPAPQQLAPPKPLAHPPEPTSEPMRDRWSRGLKVAVATAVLLALAALVVTLLIWLARVRGYGVG